MGISCGKREDAVVELPLLCWKELPSLWQLWLGCDFPFPYVPIHKVGLCRGSHGKLLPEEISMIQQNMICICKELLRTLEPLIIFHYLPCNLVSLNECVSSCFFLESCTFWRSTRLLGGSKLYVYESNIWEWKMSIYTDFCKKWRFSFRRMWILLILLCPVY